MSELHSETNDNTLGLTVRIKLVDLNHTGKKLSKTPATRSAPEHVAKERLSAIVGLAVERVACSAGTQPPTQSDYSNVEICMLTRDRVPHAEFETHIETCTICANRVDLQLDFMEALGVAVYQRNAEPGSQKVRGAMLISAPELNFAVCGELEIG